MIYCMSDIHGEYDKYMAMLKAIDLQPNDTLFVLGDVVDRGDRPADVLLDMMQRPNVVPLVGNHEVMALHNLKFLLKEIDTDPDAFTPEMLQSIMDWQAEGGNTTMKQFGALDRTRRAEVADYLCDFSLWEEISVGGVTYVLAHSAPHNFVCDADLNDCSPIDMLFDRPNYGKPYFSGKILVTGHTPTQLIAQCGTPGRIWRGSGHIAIDCGCTFGGSLGAICLDNGKEYYV